MGPSFIDCYSVQQQIPLDSLSLGICYVTLEGLFTDFSGMDNAGITKDPGCWPISDSGLCTRDEDPIFSPRIRLSWKNIPDPDPDPT